jgi:hypothetical protein
MLVVVIIGEISSKCVSTRLGGLNSGETWWDQDLARYCQGLVLRKSWLGKVIASSLKWVSQNILEKGCLSLKDWLRVLTRQERLHWSISQCLLSHFQHVKSLGLGQDSSFRLPWQFYLGINQESVVFWEGLDAFKMLKDLVSISVSVSVLVDTQVSDCRKPYAYFRLLCPFKNFLPALS